MYQVSDATFWTFLSISDKKPDKKAAWRGRRLMLGSSVYVVRHLDIYKCIEKPNSIIRRLGMYSRHINFYDF